MVPGCGYLCLDGPGLSPFLVLDCWCWLLQLAWWKVLRNLMQTRNISRQLYDELDALDETRTAPTVQLYIRRQLAAVYKRAHNKALSLL